MSVQKPKRTIDKLGRIVIPNDIRKSACLGPGDEVTFEMSGRSILLTPVTERCVLCGSKYDLVSFCDKHVCETCIKSLKLVL